MDRERLKEVHQTDLTESNINEDFVEWLKTKGPSWLLTFLICIIAWMLIQRLREHKSGHENQGWVAFQECQRPGAFEDVAAEFEDLEGLAMLARLRAADQRLAIVQTGRELDPGLTTGGEEEDAPPPEPELLTAERRDQMISLADQLYDEVLDVDDDAPVKTLFMVSAMAGKAAVAESRGELDEARSWYDRALERLGDYDVELRQQIDQRLASLEEETKAEALPTEADLAALQVDQSDVQKPAIDEPLRDLLMDGPSGLK